MKTVSLLGSGWLGLPLGQALHAKGWAVHAATTQPGKCEVLANAGFVPHLLEITGQMSQNETFGLLHDSAMFWESETLIVTLPFRRHFPDPFVYVAQMREILRHMSPHQRLLFTSSTSYYPTCDHEVDEDLQFSPIAPRLRALAAAESVIMSHPGPTTVLRLGGLYGPDRPIRSFATRGLATQATHSHVNLIHRDDVIGIIMAILEDDAGWGHVWNAVSDGHPTRATLYGVTPETPLAAGSNEFPAATPSGKIVANHKLKMALNYHFCYPNPLP